MTALIGTRSTPILMLATGIYLAATCNLSYTKLTMIHLPTTRGSAEIYQAFGIRKEVIFLVKLNQLEGSS